MTASSIMRFIQALVILPALAAAQNQVPLADRVQGWFNKAKSYLPTATPVVPTVEKVVEQKVQQKAVTVTPFNMSNWQSLLEPSSEPQDWLLYITGGNKTCFGRCGNADKAFNVRTQMGSRKCEYTETLLLIISLRRNLFSCSPQTLTPLILVI